MVERASVYECKSIPYNSVVIVVRPHTNSAVQVLIVIRGLCVVLMLLFNAFMWNTFVKALQKSRSTMEAIVVNTASNFFCTVRALATSGNQLAL